MQVIQRIPASPLLWATIDVRGYRKPPNTMVNNKVISSSYFSFGQATLVVPCQAKCSFKTSLDLDPAFYTKFNMEFEIRFQKGYGCKLNSESPHPRCCGP